MAGTCGIDPRDVAVEAEGAWGHHVAREAVVGIFVVVNLADAVDDRLLALVESAKRGTAGDWSHRFEEGLNGLEGVFHHTWGGTVVIVAL